MTDACQPVSLLLGGAGDPVLRSVAERLGTDFVWVTPEELVYSVVVDDEIERGGTCKIRWSIPGRSGVLTDAHVVGVLNRIGEFPSALFERVHPDDRKYAQAEYTAYLQFALSVFPNVANPAWGGSTSGYCQSLPYQWSVAASKGLSVPEFFYGPDERMPEVMRRNHRVIFSDNPLNPLWWTTVHDSLSAEQLGHGLYYLRPAGDALAVVVVEHEIRACNLSSRAPTNLSDSVASAVLELAEHFHLRYGSALLFRRGDTFMFGSMMADVDTGQMAPEHLDWFIGSLAALVSMRPCPS